MLRVKTPFPDIQVQAGVDRYLEFVCHLRVSLRAFCHSVKHSVDANGEIFVASGRLGSGAAGTVRKLGGGLLMELAYAIPSSTRTSLNKMVLIPSCAA